MALAKAALFVYAFAPKSGGGEVTAPAHEHLRRVWAACADLGMTAPIPELDLPTSFPSQFAERDYAFRAIAACARPADGPGVFQAFAFEYQDAVGVVVSLSPNAADEGPERWKRLGDEWWSRAPHDTLPDGLLGEIAVYVVLHDGTDALSRSETRQRIRDALPRPGPGAGAWSEPYHTALGFEVMSREDVDDRRVIVLLAPESAEDALDAWALWQNASRLAPFAWYLLHASKVRYARRVYLRDIGAARELEHAVDRSIEAMRRLDASIEADGRVDPDELTAIQNELHHWQLGAAGLISLLSRFRELARTAQIANDNLTRAIPPPHPDQPVGLYTPFARDIAGVRWLEQQVDHDIGYMEAVRERTEATYRRTSLHLEQASQQASQTQARLSLVQATMVGGLVTALAAIQALGQPWRPEDLQNIRLPLIAVLTALAVAIPPVIVYWYERYRPWHYALAGVVGLASGWLVQSARPRSTAAAAVIAAALAALCVAALWASDQWVRREMRRRRLSRGSGPLAGGGTT